MLAIITGFFIFIFAYFALYFSMGEAIIMGGSLVVSWFFLEDWYERVKHTTDFFQKVWERRFLYFLPSVPVILYLLTLRTVASYDVVEDGFYIVLYVLLGVAWLAASLQGMLLFFDFSYQDDALTGINLPALVFFSFAFVGISLIYAGANIGDGPGWWTVVFAGGLGTLSWLVLGWMLDQCTGIMDQIVRDQNLCGAIRFGSYLLAGGIILARASAGDWTSFRMTVIEFLDGWPVIPLTLSMFLSERFIFSEQGQEASEHHAGTRTMVVSILYVVYAVAAVWLLPLVK